jgi:two-component system, NtrC family, nitrogen regulation sensor histidine kinase NtrY
VLALVGLLAVLRASTRLRSRRAASAIVLIVAGLGPFLLRDLASGITAPPGGVTTTLWLWWQLALFLSAVAVLLAGASAGRAMLGPRRGIHPAVAPALAGVAALLGPLLLQAPSRWPGWYPALWILAVGALAVTRRTRGFVLLAAAVAGAGAATLTWGATVRKRVALAERDVAALREVDPYMRTLAERLADGLAAAPPDAGRASLLQAYVASPLALAGFPAALTIWDGGGEVVHADFAAYADSERPVSLGRLVREAARTGETVSADALGPGGAELAIAVPHGDGAVTTVVASPHTRLTPDDPFAALYGFALAPGAEPAYAIALTDASSPTPGPAPADGLWSREGDEVHRDYYLRTSHGLARAR